MSNRSSLLSELYQARLEDLKEIASAYGLAKNGSVEYLRAQLIRDLILSEMGSDLRWPQEHPQ